MASSESPPKPPPAGSRQGRGRGSQHRQESWASVRLLIVGLDASLQPMVLLGAETKPASPQPRLQLLGGKRQRRNPDVKSSPYIEDDHFITAERELEEETGGLLPFSLLRDAGLKELYLANEGRAYALISVFHSTDPAVWTLPQRYQALANDKRDSVVQQLIWRPIHLLERLIISNATDPASGYPMHPYTRSVWSKCRKHVYTSLAKRLGDLESFDRRRSSTSAAGAVDVQNVAANLANVRISMPPEPTAVDDAPPRSQSSICARGDDDDHQPV